MEYSTEEGGFRYIPFRIYQVSQKRAFLLPFARQASRCRHKAAQHILLGWRMTHQMGKHRLRDTVAPWSIAYAPAAYAMDRYKYSDIPKKSRPVMSKSFLFLTPTNTCRLPPLPFRILCNCVCHSRHIQLQIVRPQTSNNHHVCVHTCDFW